MAPGGGPHPSHGRPEKTYRGSKRRLKRIRWRDNTPLEFWIFVVLMLLMLFVGIPWLLTHPADHHPFRADTVIRRR
jgi:hypothetical protein